MFCAQCGVKNEDTARFCQSCGASLEIGAGQSNQNQEPKRKSINSDSALFRFIAPFLSFIDSGDIFKKPFKWLYLVIAAINALFPFYILYIAIKLNIHQAPGKFIIAFILMWIVLVFAAWISFQLWWNRSEKVAGIASSDEDFVATPVFSHFIQTFGEWAGAWIAIVGCLSSLIMVSILGEEGRMMGQAFGVDILGGGIKAVFLMPLYGFLILVFSRFVAEQFRAIAAIANNTKKLANEKDQD